MWEVPLLAASVSLRRKSFHCPLGREVSGSEASYFFKLLLFSENSWAISDSHIHSSASWVYWLDKGMQMLWLGCTEDGGRDKLVNPISKASHLSFSALTKKLLDPEPQGPALDCGLQFKLPK